MTPSGLSNFFENAGKALDEFTYQFRAKGMRGTPKEREAFLKECFHGARFNLRVVISSMPGLLQKAAYDQVVNNILAATATQARETGFTEEEVALYVNVHRKAYESLAEEFGIA